MTVLGHRALTYRRLFFLFVGGRGKGPELRIRNLISSVALSKPEPQSVHEEHHALSHLTELSRAPVNTANCGCAWMGLGKAKQSCVPRTAGGMVVSTGDHHEGQQVPVEDPVEVMAEASLVFFLLPLDDTRSLFFYIPEWNVGIREVGC